MRQGLASFFLTFVKVFLNPERHEFRPISGGLRERFESEPQIARNGQGGERRAVAGENSIKENHPRHSRTQKVLARCESQCRSLLRESFSYPRSPKN